MKNLFFILFFLLPTASLFGQNTSFNCDEVTFNGPSSVQVGHTYTFSVNAPPTVTAYHWQVPSTMEIVSGQFSSTISVFVVSPGNLSQDICVRLYEECDFIDCCKNVALTSCITPPPPPRPVDTCIVDILPTISDPCLNEFAVKLDLTEACDATILSSTWILSHGNWVGAGSVLTVQGGGIGGPHWYNPPCNFQFTITVYVETVEYGVLSNSVVLFFPCCEEDGLIQSNEVFGTKEIRISPNPTSGEISITGINNIEGVIEIRTLSGKLIHTQTMTREVISLAHLAAGSYMVSIIDKSGENIKQEKIIIVD